MKGYESERGFALATVVLAGVIVLMTLSVALTSISGVRTSLNEQYYAQLSREAAEAGRVKAEACMAANNGNVTWSGNALTPQSDCTGSTSVTCPNAACYVMQNGNLRTTFNVGAVDPGMYDKKTYTVQAGLQLVRPSDSTIAGESLSTLNYTSIYAIAPKITGGAGWDETGGHIAYIATGDNKLYGLGANYAGQLTDSATPSAVSTPVSVALPSGVTYVKKLSSSGQGASFMCMIGSDDKGYCRGGSNGLGIPGSWQVMNTPTGTYVYDIAVSGYGADRVCALAGTSTSTMKAYCWGDNDHGALGIGQSVSQLSVRAYSATAAEFILPASVYAKKIYSQSQNVCVITSNDKVYCSGASWAGQIAGTYDSADSGVKTPVQYALPAMGSVARVPKDVVIAYHSDYSNMLVLATDGTIWASGDRNGENGDGGTAGLTGTGATADGTGESSGAAADLFGRDYATGGAVKLTNYSTYCIDNEGGSSSNGNRLQIWTCDPVSGINPTEAQQWFFNDTTNAIWNPDTGKCMDLYNGNTADGTVIQLYSCTNVAAQKWAINADGTIRHMASGKCITVSSASDGSQLKLYTCSGSNYQKFTATAPTQPWKAILSISSDATGGDSFCGLRSDSSTGIWCTGYNDYGQLGNRGSSLGGSDSGSACTNTARAITMNMASGIKVDYTKISSEWQSQVDSLQVIGTDGQVYGSGRNKFGKLGSGSLGDSANDYRQCTTVKMQLPSGVTAVDMSTRDEFTTYVLGSDGRIYSAGLNYWGELGDGTTTSRSTPITVKIPRKGFVY